MSKIENKNNITVVHSNELIEASYALNLDEMRLINLALTKIDSTKPNPGVIDIYPEEFSKMFSVSNVWRTMRNAVDQIMTRPVSIIKPNEKGIIEKTNLAWLTKSVYSMDEKDGSKISVRFSEEITPYLFELKERFTIINFEHASKLTTPFSYRLYSWLMEAKHLNKAKKAGSITIELEIDWIKERAGFIGLYDRWDSFKARVIEPATDHINNKTDIFLSWEPVLKGGATHSIKFNYVIENKNTKPIRPRLFRRPKVVAGSHAEGEWMRKNLNLLIAYEIVLQNFDSSAKIEIADLKKMSEYSKKLGEISNYREYEKIISDRKKPNAAKKINDDVQPAKEELKIDAVETNKPLSENQPVVPGLFKRIKKERLKSKALN